MKSWITNIFNKLFPPVYRLPPGIYQATWNIQEKPVRAHLRIHPDGNGTLVLNARVILHLNQTAAEFAYYMCETNPREAVETTIARRYRVSAAQARTDFEDFKARIDTLLTTEDLDPEINLGLERREIHSAGSPLRADCALTYRTSINLPGRSLADRVKRELTTAEWQTILEKCWQAGIVHIVFTGGEPTTRPDLPELIGIAQAIGQVTGVITDGSRISETRYLHSLLEKGLDHLMIILQDEEEQAWEAVRDALAEDIHLTVHLTVLRGSLQRTKGAIQKLLDLGVNEFSLSAADAAAQPELREAADLIAARGGHLVWNLPVPYSDQNPVALEEGDEYPRGAGKAWIYIEPDGDVLPGQDILKPCGNLLTDEWDAIAAVLKNVDES